MITLRGAFSEASLDILSDDIEFGEMALDYISNGTMNIPRQNWVDIYPQVGHDYADAIAQNSQGINFLDELERSTYEEGQVLLSSAFAGGSVQLQDAITRSCESDFEDARALEDVSDEGLQALESNPNKEDLDDGPFTAWRSTYDQVPPTA
ncbi:hypothetical protein F5Y16DRAFT_402622 [Xylariaceae sp. FL0255]|nr:hypothetical protein F5Y16DRAFT_402622 [Xylariaceae sp. FL0255]